MKYLGLILTVAVISACAGKKHIANEDRATDKKSGISLWSSWVKDKETKYDIELFVSNDSDKTRVIEARNIHCYRGKIRGTVHMDSSKDQFMSISPGEIRRFIVICKYHRKMRGDYKVSLKKIYNDAEENRKVVGKGINYIITDQETR